MKKTLLLSLTIAAADQAIKAYVRSFAPGQILARISGLLEITHCVNTGAAFSMLSGKTLMLAVLSVLLMAAVAVAVLHFMRLSEAGLAALGCLLGGGMGNLIDRVCFGGVTDYIRICLFRFPVFNLADIAITLSVAVLLLLMLLDRLEKKTTGEDYGSDH